MIRLRLTEKLIAKTLADLKRPHEFAAERIGFLCCRQCALPAGYLLLGYRYVPIQDNQYIEDPTVGARFDSSAIRSGMQIALSDNASIFHVHLHSHSGIPRFSRTDEREMSALMPCFVNLCPDRLHGALVMSNDRACARAWGPGSSQVGDTVDRITAVGGMVRVLS